MKDTDKPEDKNKDTTVEAAKQIINRYRSTYKHIKPDVLFNLSDLKEISSEAQQEDTNAIAVEIDKRLGAAESGETLRQERWHGKVACPYCESDNIKRLALDEQKDKYIYKYLCLACNQTFNDDSETEIEAGLPPLHSWMFCWYLLGCTNSLQYIAAKLGLSVSTVEMMIQHMQKIFNANEPLKHFLSFDEWSQNHGKNYKLAMQEALAKLTERFRGFSVGQEKDTAEVRRQKNRAKPTPK